MTRVAIVTGGGRGIGAACSARLAAMGFAVVVNYRDDAVAAGRVVEAARAGGATAIAVRADASRPEDIAALFAAADRLGPLAALVNNAGVVDQAARVDAMDVARLERMFRINITGPFLCAGEAVRRMSRRYGGAGGAIVNVSSAAARLGGPGQYVDYAASKGAIDTFTVGLARELAEEGVRVNAVRPGIIDTEIHASGGQPDRVARMRDQIPMKREGSADEVAAAVAFLCSDDASYLTGAIIDVTGGR
jgi:NAD(P)-dependent dehydrogenase (short-subunit alcohol dehydrogenase family)